MRHISRRPITIGRSRKRLNYRGEPLPATRWGPTACLLLLVAMGAVLGAPVAALAAVATTSVLALGLRVGFLGHPPPSDSAAPLESVASR